jgi:hypothetical protein
MKEPFLLFYQLCPENFALHSGIVMKADEVMPIIIFFQNILPG